MALDKWIAALFLVGGLIYGYAAFTYPLLPFERNMPFLPNTLPLVLSAVAVLLSVLILLAPRATADAEGDVLGTIDLAKIREYKIGQALALAYEIKLNGLEGTIVPLVEQWLLRNG